MSLPLIAAPMFLITGARLVQACIRQGVAAVYPALNARRLEDFEAVLAAIDDFREPGDAPYGINLIVHASNSRAREELALCKRYHVPFVVTGLGMPGAVVAEVHGYGGLVFHDVATVEHARKAAAAGVDGLVLVCAGAGGHTGTLSPFAFVPAVRKFFKGEIAVAGAITDGLALRAVQALGADYGYAGTLFLTAPEAETPRAYREMVLECGAADLVLTSEVTGAPALALRPSLEAAGKLASGALSVDKKKAWRDVWSAGQGLENLTRTETVAEIVQRLQSEYDNPSQRDLPHLRQVTCSLPHRPRAARKGLIDRASR